MFVLTTVCLLPPVRTPVAWAVPALVLLMLNCKLFPGTPEVSTNYPHKMKLSTGRLLLDISTALLYLTAFAPMLFPLFLNLESLSGSVVPESFELATEKRAKERQEFEKRLANLEARREKLQERVRQQEEEREKEEIAKLRQELVSELILNRDPKECVSVLNELISMLNRFKTVFSSLPVPASLLMSQLKSKN